MEQSGNLGFRPLASFIFGNNQDKITSQPKNIAMTAPVLRHHLDSDQYQMEFILPKEFTKVEQVPEPKDNSIKAVEVPEHTLAVITFSGSWDTKELVETKEKELRQVASEKGYVLNSDPRQTASLFLSKF